jgi:hypothetical protein
MSIIVTQINKYGIVFASDSNITNDNEVVKQGDKIFIIPKLKGAIAIAGSSSVGGEAIDKWLPNFIKQNEFIYNNLEDFGILLQSSFDNLMSEEEKSWRSISHIAGYVDNHPEMWCLSNTNLDNPNYSEGKNYFHISEHFWKRDWKNNNLQHAFESDGLNYQLYVNGTTSGRVGFNVVRQYLDNYFNQMFNLPDYKFRWPKNLEEHKIMVKTYLEVLIALYELSNYYPKIIGGKVQIYTIENK